MSKHTVRGGDVAGLLKLFAQLREKAKGRTGKVFPLIVIQEAGLDGFWIDRVLHNEGIESHVVDPASIATSRRRRRAKTDGIDGEALIRALLAYKRGEPRVCSMVRVPTPEDEDQRRLCRERKVLTIERVQHVNRIKGLLFSQGVSGYEPLRRDRRGRLDALQTGDGRPLPQHLKAQVCRELGVGSQEDRFMAARQISSICLSGIQGPEPDCMTRLVSEHDQPHIRSPFATAANIPLAAGKAQEDRERFFEMAFGHGLLRFVDLDPSGLLLSWGLRDWSIGALSSVGLYPLLR